MRYNLAVIGMGNRAGKYLQWVQAHPETVRLAAVVDPDALRLHSAARQFGLAPDVCFSTAEDLFSSTVSIDAVIIASPDQTHEQFAMAAIRRGWHVLLEKPAATRWEACLALSEAARSAGVYVSVCFILRLYPYWKRFREIVSGERFGKLLSLHHEVNAGIDRCVHTFVRGLWSREEDSSPLVLSKCCHDMDLLVYLTGAEPLRVASFGSLGWFREENAPKGAGERCIACPIEEGCAFSAVDLYRRRNAWNLNFDRREGESFQDAVERELREGRYGRCAFRCDNDVADHQSVLMEMQGGATVSLRLNCLTQEDNRLTWANGSGGEVYGDGQHLTVRYFDTEQQETFDFSAEAGRPLHGGADLEIVRDFFERIESGDYESPTHISRCLGGHRACFEAEAFRKGMR